MHVVPPTNADSVVDFARRLLLDLLFLLERRVSGRHNENTLLRSLLPLLPLEEDPVTELLSVVMDTLDGTRGMASSLFCEGMRTHIFCGLRCAIHGTLLVSGSVRSSSIFSHKFL